MKPRAVAKSFRATTFEAVAGEGEGRSGEADQRYLAFEGLGGLAHGFEGEGARSRGDVGCFELINIRSSRSVCCAIPGHGRE